MLGSETPSASPTLASAAYARDSRRIAARASSSQSAQGERAARSSSGAPSSWWSSRWAVRAAFERLDRALGRITMDPACRTPSRRLEKHTLGRCPSRTSSASPSLVVARRPRTQSARTRSARALSGQLDDGRTYQEARTTPTRPATDRAQAARRTSIVARARGDSAERRTTPRPAYALAPGRAAPSRARARMSAGVAGTDALRPGGMGGAW